MTHFLVQAAEDVLHGSVKGAPPQRPLVSRSPRGGGRSEERFGGLAHGGCSGDPFQLEG